MYLNLVRYGSSLSYAGDKLSLIHGNDLLALRPLIPKSLRSGHYLNYESHTNFHHMSQSVSVSFLRVLNRISIKRPNRRDQYALE